MAPDTNQTGLLQITPAIEIANEDIMPGQPISIINSAVIRLNHFLYYMRDSFPYFTSIVSDYEKNYNYLVFR